MSGSSHLMPLPLLDQRYAQAIFDLAREEGCVEDVSKGLLSLSAALDQDEDLQRFTQNPFLSEKKQIEVMCAVCENVELASGTGDIIRNFLCVIAKNRRLSVLSGILRAFQHRVASSRGEVSAQVISARPLDDNQKKKLRTALEESIAGKIILRIVVDPTILGGLIVRLKSYQVDASIAAKLSSLKLALRKEVS